MLWTHGALPLPPNAPLVKPVLTRVLFFLSTHHSYHQAQEDPTNDHASIGLFLSLGISA